MNIIGLGNAGCAIAEGFGRYPQYKIFQIDTGPESDFDFIDQYGDAEVEKKTYNIKRQESPEEYETSTPSLKVFFGDMSGQALLVIGGSGHISAMCLRIMEQIKDKCELSVLYIRPDVFMLDETKRRHEKVSYNVLQQYARSGAIKTLYLVANTNLENILGEVPIMGYYDKLNKLLVSTLHMVNVYKNTKPIMGSLASPSKDSTKKICTVGIFDIEKNEEKLFFPLDTVREKGYIYSISKGKLQTSSDLHKMIRNQMKEKSQDDDVNVSFGIFPSDYKTDYGYVLAYSPNIQN